MASGRTKRNGIATDRDRASFRRLAWKEAFDELSAADRETPLEPEDVERLAMAAYLLGRDSDAADAWSRAHNEYLTRGDVARAARCAFWVALGLLFHGAVAQANGWVSRGRRLLDETQLDCAAQGFLLVPVALQQMLAGEHAAAHAAFSEAAAIGDRFGEPDLMTLGRLGQGQTLIALGRIAEGVARLDEVMVAVTAGEASPFTVGLVYCAVIETCQDIFDLRRAQEWTAALNRWCESQPDLVPFRGQCLTRRAELLRLNGAWQESMREAERARERLSDPPNQAAVGLAWCQQAELHRLRGDFAHADDAYRQASRWDRKPRPGLALLRLAQGQLSAAQAAIRRLLDEARDDRTRPDLLAAFVEIMLAAGEPHAARAAADELSKVAATLGAPYLHALSARATGAVLLAEGDARGALVTLRDAWMSWQELEAPYEAARTRVTIALVCRTLGDEDGAEAELDAARSVFHELGAAPDLARVEQLSRRAPTRGFGRLTPREVEVIRLVATGKTNRAIAAELFISEKTVARHLNNLFTKLGLETRAAAAAYAYRHKLM
jgi:DNA-binding CsgD family transcriptional regulator